MEQKKKRPAGSDFWQIIFPSALGALILILLGVWLVLSAGTANVSRFAEISTVLLVVPVFFLALLVGLILVGVIYGVSRFMDLIPRMTEPVLAVLEKIRQAAGAFSKASARLVIEPTAWVAGVKKNKHRADQEIQLNDQKGGKQL
jgi:membrane protein required for beta-lactamase induction